MADILLQWVNEDVGLAEPVASVSEVSCQRRPLVIYYFQVQSTLRDVCLEQRTVRRRVSKH